MKSLEEENNLQKLWIVCPRAFFSDACILRNFSSKGHIVIRKDLLLPQLIFEGFEKLKDLTQEKITQVLNNTD